ncbi:hypothetical protein NDU88_000903 [Pleurodeles waltl]|uniref:Uncharacterized protein n=1 Tax=Pleurodeles waltl TaxID=8319 RepID=A0AAV7KQM6_PLEWA|nr:hypothetical protein NDU88_000903 [Pleurodeles waltl]
MCWCCRVQPRAGGLSNQSLWLLGLKGARRPAHTLENVEKEAGRAADEEASVEEAGVWGREDRRQQRPPVKSQDTSEGEDVSRTLTAAHREDSSHGSGEVWHSQVRP